MKSITKALWMLAALMIWQVALLAQSGTPAPASSTVSKSTRAVGYQVGGGDTKVDLKATPLMPQASGEAKVEAKQGAAAIEVEIKGLAQPGKLGSEFLAYVLWGVSPDGRTSNLGEIVVENSGEGKLKATTQMQTFSLIVTAEPYSSVRQPSELVVLENEIRKGTKGKIFIVNDYKLMKRSQYQKLGNPLALSLNLKDVPLEMYQARNSVEIAKMNNAPKYAAEIFVKAESSLKMAENALVRKSNKKEIISTARQTIQFSEDARALAVQRQDDERIENERLAAAAKARSEAEAKASAEAAEAKRRSDAEAVEARRKADADAAVAKFKAEEEARHQAELAAAEQARLKAITEEVRRKAELEAQRQAETAAAERAKLQAEAEAIKRKAEEDARQQAELAAAERAKLQAEAEAIKRKAEEDAKQQAELAAAERAKLKAEAEDLQRRRDEEAKSQANLAAAEQARLQALAVEEKRKSEEDAKRQAELAAAREAQIKAEADAAALKAKAEADALKARGDADALKAKADADALRAKEEAARAEAERARIAAETLRAQLLEQFNRILSTRDTARGLVVNMADVLFDTGKYTLHPATREKLARLSGIMLAHSGLNLEIEGHTDSTGSDELNQTLSLRRSETVRAYLIEQGLVGDKVTAKGFGKTMPVADNSTAAGRQQNRRVEIVVSGEVIGTALGK